MRGRGKDTPLAAVAVKLLPPVLAGEAGANVALGLAVHKDVMLVGERAVVAYKTARLCFTVVEHVGEEREGQEKWQASYKDRQEGEAGGGRGWEQRHRWRWWWRKERGKRNDRRPTMPGRRERLEEEEGGSGDVDGGGGGQEQ